MLLKRGITGFIPKHECDTLPRFSFEEFQSVVHAAAVALRMSIANSKPCGITPNFHRAQLNDSQSSTQVLGHSIYPLIAFAELASEQTCQLRFLDCPRIAATIQTLFPNLIIASLFELSQPIAESDFELLDDVERKQIRYWKPATIGQVVFNWWD